MVDFNRWINIRLSLLEIFLVQTIVWLALWLLNDYVAALLTLIVGLIVLAVLLIALIAEGIERSKVPKRYFQVMGISILSLLFSALLYVGWLGGRLDFLQQ
ncbi:MAG: hypothetical protein SFV22_03825 [Saprospiraceae bacterium]|nr:hypothetical protein [Saprospiraceae bacterium]